MKSLPERLREASGYALMDNARATVLEAADEIERLRETGPCQVLSQTNFTLTDAEREAVRFFSLIDGPHNVPVANKRAATLRGLLDRTQTGGK